MGWQGRYYNGKSPQDYEVLVSIEQGKISVQVSGGIQNSYAPETVKLLPPLGKTDRIMRLPDGGSLHFPPETDLQELSHLLGHKDWHRLLHQWERNLGVVLLSVVIVGFLGWGFFRYGMPIIAKDVASKLSPEIRATLANQTLMILDKSFFDASGLDRERQREIQEGFQVALERAKIDEAYYLEFRSSKAFGPNAFALPGGTMVLLDELVDLVESDDEIIAVLAHEMGHIAMQHPLRSAIQSASVVIVVSILLSDLNSVAVLATSFPAMIMEKGYSREFEDEADQYAMEMLIRSQIGLMPMIRVFERFKELYDDSAEPVWLSTHPLTVDRINAIEARKSEMQLGLEKKE